MGENIFLFHLKYACKLSHYVHVIWKGYLNNLHLSNRSSDAYKVGHMYTLMSLFQTKKRGLCQLVLAPRVHLVPLKWLYSRQDSSHSSNLITCVTCPLNSAAQTVTHLGQYQNPPPNGHVNNQTLCSIPHKHHINTHSDTQTPKHVFHEGCHGL